MLEEWEKMLLWEKNMEEIIQTEKIKYPKFNHSDYLEGIPWLINEYKLKPKHRKHVQFTFKKW